MTKKELKIAEKKSLNRTLAEIISDTRSGDPLKKENGEEGGRRKKRDVKAEVKKEKAVKDVSRD